MKTVLQRAERGERLGITRRGQTVAELGRPAGRRTKPEPWPDLEARRRAIFGDRQTCVIDDLLRDRDDD